MFPPASWLFKYLSSRFLGLWDHLAHLPWSMVNQHRHEAISLLSFSLGIKLIGSPIGC
jgi:hypothetical protein